MLSVAVRISYFLCQHSIAIGSPTENTSRTPSPQFWLSSVNPSCEGSFSLGEWREQVRECHSPAKMVENGAKRPMPYTHNALYSCFPEMLANDDINPYRAAWLMRSWGRQRSIFDGWKPKWPDLPGQWEVQWWGWPVIEHDYSDKNSHIGKTSTLPGKLSCSNKKAYSVIGI